MMSVNNKTITKNLFELNSTLPQVYVAAGEGAYKNTINALNKIDLSPAKGKKVLLKPNAGRLASKGEGITTDPQVVAAAIDAFKQAGADVSVGESPITGVNAMKAFESTGITAVTLERNCRLIDMDKRPFVPLEIPEGRAIKEIKVCADVFDHDIIVSIPVMKTHMHTIATLSLKNMKGCLWRRSKVDLHMLPMLNDMNEIPLNVAIADMSGVLRPHLSIVDGTVGMEGMGPSGGKAKKLGLVVAGTDAFAVDSIACRLMGLCAEDIPHLRMGAERGYGLIDIEKIKIHPETWMNLVSPFSPPPDNLSIEFSEFNILDKNSCSACQSTLILFLKKYGKVIPDYFPENTDINIAIGKGHDKVPKNTICIGNCMAKFKQQKFVKGCPPVGSEILKTITGKTSLGSDKVRREVKE
jgi:uncharacterized protein (DUF362 family)